jgi:peptidoglycan/xylan/chitin deacetylase (PgdA/CDA1 family)
VLVAFALATTAVLAACGSDPASPTTERTSTRSQALSATTVPGTSLPAKTLCLTFDDGPGYGTSAISTYLAAQGVPATFFVNGAYIAATTLPNDNSIKLTPNAAAILAQIVADGHLVANHGTTHRSLPAVLASFGAAEVVQELAETDTDIAPYVPSNHFLFRAPFGFQDANVWSALAPSPMNKYLGPIGWEIGGAASNYPAQAADWACWVNALQSGGGGPTFGANPHECGDAYLAEIAAKSSGIVLMHDSSHTDNGGTTLALVQYVVPILKARGYAFVRADEVPDIAALFPSVPCDASCATCNGEGPSKCTSCSSGRWLSGGACTACGSCDDSNACTADTCDAKNGCTHSAIDDCPPSAPPPTGAAEDAAPPEDAEAPVVVTSDAPAPASASAFRACSIARAGGTRTGGRDGALVIAIGALSAAFLRRTRRRGVVGQPRRARDRAGCAGSER